MELVSKEFLEDRQLFLFHTQTEEVLVQMNWKNTYEPIGFTFLDIKETTESTVREYVDELGLYSDDPDVYQWLSVLLPEIIKHYDLPMYLNRISMPNRSLLLLSCMKFAGSDFIHGLLKGIVEADVTRTPLPEKEEEEVSEPEEVVIYADEIEDDEVIEELVETMDLTEGEERET